MTPRTAIFDPGYDSATVCSHIEQSHHLIMSLKLSMACWIIASQESVRQKVLAARARNVRTVTGGGPFEMAACRGNLAQYLDLCASIGVDCIEAGEGFTELPHAPAEVMAMAWERGLEVQFEIGKKHGGPFAQNVEDLIDQGRDWLDVGAVDLIIEARESAIGVGLFDATGQLDRISADAFARAFGLETIIFEAPNRQSQFALLNHFGSSVRLANVRIEELLRVEIYRRGLHSDSFGMQNLRPKPVDETQL